MAGCRYLEYFEFRLVREALIERETLAARHAAISPWPMRFVLPFHKDMRFRFDDAGIGGGFWPVSCPGLKGPAPGLADPAGIVPL